MRKLQWVRIMTEKVRTFCEAREEFLEDAETSKPNKQGDSNVSNLSEVFKSYSVPKLWFSPLYRIIRFAET